MNHRIVGCIALSALAVVGLRAVASGAGGAPAGSDAPAAAVGTGAWAHPGAAQRFLTAVPAPDADLQGRVPHPSNSFVFTRAIYSGGRGGWGRGGRAWATDYPKADNQFNVVLRRLVDIDAYPRENAVTLDDPDVRRFPFLYALEVGNMQLTSREVAGLRSYLLAGGFLMIDDFWGTYEWRNFEREIRQVLPEYDIVEIPMDHPLFRSFYQIDTIIQVPARGNFVGGRTWEQDGYTPHVRGIFDDEGRLLVGINWNTDLGDAWEWAEQPDYPLQFSTYAFQMAVNFVVYAMSH